MIGKRVSDKYSGYTGRVEQRGPLPANTDIPVCGKTHLKAGDDACLIRWELLDDSGAKSIPNSDGGIQWIPANWLTEIEDQPSSMTTAP